MPALAVQYLTGDALEQLATIRAGSADCCVTSPPYFGLRDYGVDGQIGLEKSPDDYVSRLVEVFRGVRRVLRPDGTLWLNLGDSYAAGKVGRDDADRPNGARLRDGKRGGNSAGSKVATLGARPRPVPAGLKPKDLIGIPWRVAFALQADGWYLRSEIIWEKSNPMPESVRDRPTRAHEQVFLLAKSGRYYLDGEAIREAGVRPPGRATRFSKMAEHGGRAGARGRKPSGNEKPGGSWTTTGTRHARSVWTIAVRPYRGAHFATMPPALAERCIRAGSRAGGLVLDPFSGAGTTPRVAEALGRRAIGIDLNGTYHDLARARPVPVRVGPPSPRRH